MTNKISFHENLCLLGVKKKLLLLSLQPKKTSNFYDLFSDPLSQNKLTLPHILPITLTEIGRGISHVANGQQIIYFFIKNMCFLCLFYIRLV